MELNNLPQFEETQPQPSSASVEPQQPPGTSGGKLEVNAKRISCCYGFMVFLGLALSLLTLTLLVIYAGVWSQHTLYGKTLGPPKMIKKMDSNTHAAEVINYATRLNLNRDPISNYCATLFENQLFHTI